jgi:TPR repeat protein
MTFLISGLVSAAQSDNTTASQSSEIINLQKSCFSGNSSYSCFGLGIFYEEGHGVEQDLSKAVELFKRSCKSKYYIGCWYLAGMYLRGDKINQDDTQAALFYQEACSKGGIGCETLASLYAVGQGVDKDPFKAAELNRKICDFGGDVIRDIGCIRLGVAYELGQGVRQSNSEALKYYGRACDLKNQIGCDAYANLKSAR